MRPVLTVWLGWTCLMAGANLATPLYAVYAQQFRFSSLVLTAIFATYAVVLVPSLVVFGRLSDRFGRRLVLLLGLAAALGGLALFAAAQSAPWLFAARALQGLAVGMTSGAATAALVALDPHGDRRRAALFAGLAQAGGSALGPIAAGVLAQWAPAPTRLCYLVALGATCVAAAFVLRLPEPQDAEGEPWRVQWPRVPREARGPFARVALTAGVVWATLALFLSIVPSYAGGILQTKNLALLAAIAAIALVASSGTHLAARRLVGAGNRAQALGLVLLAAGLAGLVAASPLASLALLAAGAAAAGAGHGLAFLNAQQELNELAPDERRGEVTSAFIACIYAIVAGSVIATGVLDRWFSLSLSVGIVAVVLIVLAAAAAVWQARARCSCSTGSRRSTRSAAAPARTGRGTARRRTARTSS